MKRQQDGFTLIELIMTLSVLTVGLLGLAASMLGSTQLAREGHETDVLKTALGNVVERLHQSEFRAIVTDFGPGSGRQEFWVASDGEIEFAEIENAVATGSLKFFNRELGIPAPFEGLHGGFDLNANGSIENGTIDDYVVLPLRVTLSFTSDRDQDLEFAMILAKDGIR